MRGSELTEATCEVNLLCWGEVLIVKEHNAKAQQGGTDGIDLGAREIGTDVDSMNNGAERAGERFDRPAGWKIDVCWSNRIAR